MSQVKRNSGQPKQKWTEEEEQALKDGVERHGVGKWRMIQKDTSCGPILANRSNVDLKDKWRNLNMEARDSSQPKSAGIDPDFQVYMLTSCLPNICSNSGAACCHKARHVSVTTP